MKRARTLALAALVALSAQAGLLGVQTSFAAQNNPEDGRVNATRIRPVVATLELPDPEERTFQLSGWHGTVFDAPRGVDLEKLEGRRVKVFFDNEGYVAKIHSLERTG